MQWPCGLCRWTPELGPKGGGYVRAVPALPHVAAENKVRAGGRLLKSSAQPPESMGAGHTLLCDTYVHSGRSQPLFVLPGPQSGWQLLWFKP